MMLEPDVADVADLYATCDCHDDDLDAAMTVFDNKTVLRKSLKQGCAGVATPLKRSAGDGENCRFTVFAVIWNAFKTLRSVVLFPSVHAYFLATFFLATSLPALLSSPSPFSVIARLFLVSGGWLICLFACLRILAEAASLSAARFAVLTCCCVCSAAVQHPDESRTRDREPVGEHLLVFVYLPHFVCHSMLQ